MSKGLVEGMIRYNRIRHGRIEEKREGGVIGGGFKDSNNV